MPCSGRSSAPHCRNHRCRPDLKGQRRPADVIGNAIRVAQIATGEVEEEFS